MGRRETNRGFSSSQANALVLSNSISEAVLFSEVIPGGKMGTNKKCYLEVFCTLSTPLVSVPTGTVRVKFGSATLVVFSGVTLAASQNDTPFIIRVKIRNKESASSQIVFVEVNQAASNLPMLLANSMLAYGSWSVDTTVDQTLSVTAQFGALSGSTVLTVRDADLDLS